MIGPVNQLLCRAISPADFLDRLGEYFPDLEKLSETPQDPLWHGEGNVRIHTELVLDELLQSFEQKQNSVSEEEVNALVIGAALHDIGKVRTTKKKMIDGVSRIVSPRHAEFGMSYCASLLSALPSLSENIFFWVLGIIGYHHHPRKLISSNSARGLYCRIARSVPLHLLGIFEQADLRGRICEDLDGQLEVLELFQLEAENYGVWKRSPYENWRRRIVSEFGVNEGKESDYVFNAAVFLYENGEINSLEEAVGKTYERRGHHGRLLLLCGPSGSGKSEWVSAYLKCHEVKVVSLDVLREKISGKRMRQTDNGKVMQAAKELLREGLRKHDTIIWDATSLRRDGRRALISMAHDYQATSEMIRFAVDPVELRRRNRKRENKVPDDILTRQIDRYEWPHVWEAHQVNTVVST